MSYDPNPDLVAVTYHPPMVPRYAVELTAENFDAMYEIVGPESPILQRPDFTPAEIGDYAVMVPDVRQLDQFVWVVIPIDWITVTDTDHPLGKLKQAEPEPI